MNDGVTFDNRPAPFWFLNHKLQKEEIERQIKLMKKSGLSGFFIHSRAGLKTPYGSDEWFNITKYIVEEAEKEGLKVWLYDEDPFPSGIAGGRVIFDHPEFAARSIAIKKILPDENGRMKASLGGGKLLSAYALQLDEDGNIRQKLDITTNVGIIRPMYLKSPWNSSYYVGIKDKKEFPHFRAETFYPELHIDVVLKGSGWVIYTAVAEIVLTDSKFGVLPDNLNKECVRAFIEYTHEMYRNALEDKFGNSVPGIFTDEPAAGGNLPWTGVLEEEFRKEKGYDLKENYFHLADTFGDESRKIRQDYWSVINMLYNRNFYSQIASWCCENKLMFTGHVIFEEDPIGQVITGGNAYGYQKYFDIPGFDIIAHNTGDREFPSLLFGAKLIASAAHQQGKRQILGECLGCNAFNFGPEGMIRFANWLFALGITWLIPHGFYYSIDGDRKYDAGKSFFFQDLYFDKFIEFSEYTGRLGQKLAGADHVSNTCLLYPVTSFWRLIPAETGVAEKLRDQLYYTVRTLFEEHVEFDIIDDMTLFSSDISEGNVLCGAESYHSVIVPDCTYLSEDIMMGLKTMENKGVKVIVCEAEGKMDINTLKSICAVITEVTGSDMDSDHKNLIIYRKRTCNEHLMFAFNNSKEPGKFSVEHMNGYICYMYDAARDVYYSRKPEKNKISISLNGYGAACLVFTTREIDEAESYTMPLTSDPVVPEYESKPLWNYIPPIDYLCAIKDWNISVKDGFGEIHEADSNFCLIRDIAGTELDYLKQRSKRPIFDGAKEIASRYPMEVIYNAKFELLKDNFRESCLLLMENDTLQGDCKIYINGVELLRSEFTRKTIYDYFNLVADIGGSVKLGENQICIKWNSAGEFDGLKSALYIIDQANYINK